MSAPSISSTRATSGLRVGAVVAHLLAVPANPDAELKPPVGYQIDAGDLLGKVDDIPLRQQGDPGADQQPIGDRRHSGQRDKRIQRSVVLARQVPARRIGSCLLYTSPSPRDG